MWSLRVLPACAWVLARSSCCLQHSKNHSSCVNQNSKLSVGVQVSVGVVVCLIVALWRTGNLDKNRNPLRKANYERSSIKLTSSATTPHCLLCCAVSSLHTVELQFQSLFSLLIYLSLVLFSSSALELLKTPLHRSQPRRGILMSLPDSMNSWLKPLQACLFFSRFSSMTLMSAKGQLHSGKRAEHWHQQSLLRQSSSPSELHAT